MMPPPKPATVLTACFVAVVAFAVMQHAPAVAQAPTDLFATAESLTGAALRQELHRLARLNHTKRSLTFVEDNILVVADQDPYDPSGVIDVYLNLSLPKLGATERPWETEHAWPVSYGFDPDDIRTDCNVPYADAHHLFVSSPAANGSGGHSNRRFDSCPSTASCTSVPDPPQGEVVNRRSADTWEVWRGRRGDIARSMLYMDVRYDGGPTEADKPSTSEVCHDEPDLVLTADIDRIRPTGGITTGVAYYGNLETLIRWSFEDPVDERESDRNDLIREHQGNVNPFVLRPDLICRVHRLGRCTALWLPYVGK